MTKDRKIIFQGSLTKKDVVCVYNKISSRKIDPVIEEKAKKIWQEKLKEAKEQGKKVWDQAVYRFEKIQIKNNICKLKFSTIPFSIRMSVKDFTDDLAKKGKSYLPMASYSLVFIQTIDNSFVFGEKSDKFVANRKYSYVGGVFNKSEDYDDKTDLFKAASNEIKEEVGVDKSDIKKFRLLGAFISESSNVGFVFYCKLDLSKEEVLKKFRNRKDLELNNLFFAGKNELMDICINKIGKEPEIVKIFENNFNE